MFLIKELNQMQIKQKYDVFSMMIMIIASDPSINTAFIYIYYYFKNIVIFFL